MINTDKQRKKRQIKQATKKQYRRSKCKWCGKTYTKTSNRQTYCKQHCKQEARRERDRQWQQKHKTHRRRVGTTHISQHANNNTDIEQYIIQKEKRRTGI